MACFFGFHLFVPGIRLGRRWCVRSWFDRSCLRHQSGSNDDRVLSRTVRRDDRSTARSRFAGEGACAGSLPDTMVSYTPVHAPRGRRWPRVQRPPARGDCSRSLPLPSFARSNIRDIFPHAASLSKCTVNHLTDKELHLRSTAESETVLPVRPSTKVREG